MLIGKIVGVSLPERPGSWTLRISPPIPTGFMAQSITSRIALSALVALALVGCSDAGPPAGIEIPDTGGSDDGGADATGSPDTIGAVDGGADAVDPDAGSGDTGETPDATEDTGPDEGGFGWPCEDPEDCDSGYCVRTEVGGDRVCTVPCLDECEEDGWECAPIENLEGDRVFLCLPEVDNVCRACEADEDCSSLSSACTTLEDGAFCLPRCATDDDCDAGFACERAPTAEGDAEVCLPMQNVCAGCYDPDDDGYGIGADCELDCAPNDPTISPGAAELCNGGDDDCDGDIDEDFDFSSDADHCGACGVSCDAAAASTLCVEGACEILRCDEGFVDCDGLAENGCERPADTLNACGGCTTLDDALGAACGACDTGEWVCDGPEGLTCAGDDEGAENACGGCVALDGAPGAACGTCGSGAWVCDGEDAVTCAGDDPDRANTCGGCVELDAEPASPCGTCGSGEWVCDGIDDLRCVGDEGPGALNACGGCAVLDARPGDGCGTCGSGRYICDGEGGLTCEGDDGAAALNACGGCAALAGAPDGPCGTCGSGAWVCDGGEAVTCGGDLGDGALNACGGCSVLGATPGDACGACGAGVWICDGRDGLACFGDDTDSDGDGVCDREDACPGFDDDIDRDGDGVPDACDDCPADNPDDSDGDTICDSADVCPGEDDRVDTDFDGVPNACDDCPLDNPDDSDGDGVCDTGDACPGFDDGADVDGDGVPDGCDEETCDGVDNDGDTEVDEGCDEGGWTFYGLPYDYYDWDANAAALLGRAATYNMPPGVGIAVVSECVDTSGSTSASAPGGPYLGEFNATIAALEYTGIAPARIVRVANASEAASTAGSWDVIVFPEMERCAPSAASWIPVLSAAQSAGKRIISTYPSASNGSFLTAVGLFGTGSSSSQTAPYAWTAADPGFAAGLTPAGYQNATSSWSWTADGLEVLQQDASGRAMVIRIRGGDAPPVARHNVYLLPYDFFAWDAPAASLLARAATYENVASPRIAVVSECVDTSGSTSASAPGGPYSGEYNATIAAFENGGIPAGNIVRVANVSEALATRATWNVIVFPEQESCAVDPATWRAAMNTFVAEGKRVIVTFPNSRSAAFLNGLDGFGSGSNSSATTPYAYTDAAFADGRAMPQYHSATGSWSWTGTDLEVLAEDASGRDLVVRFVAE